MYEPYDSPWPARRKAIHRKRATHKVIFFIVLLFPLTLTAISSIPNNVFYVSEAEAAVAPEIVRAEIKDLSEGLVVKSETIREVTKYTSTPHQTDSTPCIGSSGEDQCELWKQGMNICATNAFPNGTILYVDKLGYCVVKDAMNKRYANRIDWYDGFDQACLDGIDEGDRCPNYRRALEFGTQKLLVKVYNRHLATR